MGRLKNVVGDPSTRTSTNCPGNIGGRRDPSVKGKTGETGSRHQFQ